MAKQNAPSCERNKQPILDVITPYLAKASKVLEIGSGTGQHAVFFAENLPHLIWQTSDVAENHNSINAWITESTLSNIQSPVEFMLGRDPWPSINVDAVFTANTTHIMQPQEAKTMMELVAKQLPKGGVFCQYGPMKVNGEFTSDSNQAFDQKIRSEGRGGIRDIEELKEWAVGMQLSEVHSMPANNFLLVWCKTD